MKLDEYGLIVTGYAMGERFKLTPKTLSRLAGCRFSYRKNSLILVLKNGYRQIFIKFDRARVQVKLFASKQSVPILSYVERGAFSGFTKPAPLLNTIAESVSAQLQTRKRNVEEIKELLLLIESIIKEIPIVEPKC